MHANNTYNSPANMGGVVYIFQNHDHCNLAKQNGYPATFFDEYHFTSQTFPELFNNCKNSKHVFVVFEDNDFSKESAIDLGCKLAKEGIGVFLTTLPANYLMINDSNLSMFKKMADESPFLIEFLINNLTDNYQKAAPEISDIIAPLILKLDSVSQKHYVNLIAKRIQTKIKIVTELIHSTKQDTIAEDPEEENFNEEILQKAQELSKNPELMKIHVDLLNEAGVVGERKNIAMLLCTVNSRLVHASSSKPGQYVLATNIAGHHGSGKSYNLMHVLQAQPKNAYMMVTSASDQSLFHLKGGIKHKCLIFSEAFQFTGKNEDNYVAYIVRSLLSDGQISRLVTIKDEDGQNVTKKFILEGPASFITTTIEIRLEPQLEDRMITIHPDESTDQTRRIVMISGKKAAGENQKLDINEKLTEFRAFHDILEPVSVLIPFADEVAHQFASTKLPINARRAFNKLLNLIRAVACTYQYQREKDKEGNVLAEYADYFMAVQIYRDTLKENLSQTTTAANEKLDYICENGHVSIKDLADHFGVTKAAISKWTKSLVEDGELTWVDSNGVVFQDDKAMNSAKRSGKAFIALNETVTNPWEELGLPSVHDLTQDTKWKEGGEFYMLYDLKLNEIQSPHGQKVDLEDPGFSRIEDILMGGNKFLSTPMDNPDDSNMYGDNAFNFENFNSFTDDNHD